MPAVPTHSAERPSSTPPAAQAPGSEAEEAARSSALAALAGELSSTANLLRSAAEAAQGEDEARAARPPRVLPLLLTRLASHDARAAALSSAYRRLASHCRSLAPSLSAFAFDEAAAQAAGGADLEETRQAVVAASQEAGPAGHEALTYELREVLAAAAAAVKAPASEGGQPGASSDAGPGAVRQLSGQLHDVALGDEGTGHSPVAGAASAPDGLLVPAPATRSPLDEVASEGDAPGGGQAPPAAAAAAEVPVVGEVELGTAVEFVETKDSLLGSGGFGRVFAGSLLVPGGSRVAVAVKVLHVTSAQLGTRQADALRSEAAQLADLQHGHLVRLLAWSFGGPRLALMFELAPRGSLDRVIHSSASAAPCSLDWPHRVALAQHAACGLAYLHSRGLTHGDVKSANVLLFDAPPPAAGRPGGGHNTLVAKLADFGFVAARAETGATRSSRSPGGSPGWMAPELWDEGTHTPASDVYALGCVLYELAARQAPWAGKSPAQVVGLVVTGKRPQRPDGTPDAVWAATQAAWAQQPHSRPRASDVEQAMRALLAGNSPQAHAAIGPGAAAAPPAPAAKAPPASSAAAAQGGRDPAAAAASRIAAFVAFASEAAEVAAVVAVNAAEAAMAAAAQAAEEGPPLVDQVSEYLARNAPSTGDVVDAFTSIAASTAALGGGGDIASGLSPAAAVAEMQRHVQATLPQRDLFAARVLLEDESAESAAAAAYSSAPRGGAQHPQQQQQQHQHTMPAPPPLMLAPTATRPLRLAFKDADAFAAECDSIWRSLVPDALPTGPLSDAAPDRISAARKALLDEGALRLVCDGVCAHARSSPAAAAGVRCLSALCGGTFTAGDAAQAQEVVAAATVVASAMRAHAAVAEVQLRGAEALGELAPPLAAAAGGSDDDAVPPPGGWEDRPSAPPAAASGASAVVAALRAHAQDEAVCAACAAALHALAQNSAGGCAAVAEAGGAGAVVGAATRAMGEDSTGASDASPSAVATSACGVLACLGSDPRARQRALDAGGMALTLEVMRRWTPQLAANPAARTAAASACDALAALAASTEALGAAAGALPLVVAATQGVECSSAHWPLHGSACAAIRALAAVPDDGGAVAATGAVAAVLRVLKAAAGSEEDGDSGAPQASAQRRIALLRSCAALRRLCLAPGCVDQALGYEAPQVLTHAVSGARYANDADVGEHVCLALRRLCTTPAGRAACVGAHAPGAVVACLAAHCGASPGVREAGAAAMHSLVAGAPDIAAGAVRAGAVQALAATMAGATGGGGVDGAAREREALEQCGWALFNCLSEATEGVDIQPQHLAQAAQALCSTLRRCPPGASGLADACSRAMLALVLRPGGASCVSDPAVVGLCHSMGSTTAVAAAQEACCGALRTLALFPQARAVALNSGALAACGAALSAHPSHAGVAEHACGALANLTADPGLWVPKRLASPRLAASVATAMRAHRGAPGSTTIQCLGAGALRNLAAHTGVRAQAVASGTLESVVASLNTHPDDASVAESAAGALWALATSQRNAQAAVRDGAASALVAALVSHGDVQPQCAHLALGALRCFNAASAECRAAVLDAGGLDAARAAATAMAAIGGGDGDAAPAANAAAAQARGLVAELEAPPPAYRPEEEEEEEVLDEEEVEQRAKRADKSAIRQCGFFL